MSNVINFPVRKTLTNTSANIESAQVVLDLKPRQYDLQGLIKLGETLIETNKSCPAAITNELERRATEADTKARNQARSSKSSALSQQLDRLLQHHMKFPSAARKEIDKFLSSDMEYGSGVLFDEFDFKTRDVQLAHLEIFKLIEKLDEELIKDGEAKFLEHHAERLRAQAEDLKNGIITIRTAGGSTRVQHSE